MFAHMLNGYCFIIFIIVINLPGSTRPKSLGIVIQCRYFTFVFYMPNIIFIVNAYLIMPHLTYMPA